MREPGHPCTRRRCRTPVEVMRKAALHGDWHPVPTSLQTRCSPAGPERQSALNSRPLRALCSTSILSGPSTAIIWLHPDSRSFAVPPARLHVWPPVHAGMSMGMDSTWPQHANMPPRPRPRTLCHVLGTLTHLVSVSASLPVRLSLRGEQRALDGQRARDHTRRGLLMRPSVLKQRVRRRFVTASRPANIDKVRRPATCDPISHDMISSLHT